MFNNRFTGIALFLLVLYWIPVFNELKAQDKDTSEVWVLIDSSKKYININTELSEEILGVCLALTKKQEYDRGLANVYSNLGVLRYYQGNFPAAISLYNKADSVLETITDSNLHATVYSNRAIIYTMLEDYNQAMDDYLIAIDINTTRKNIDKLASNYTNLGGIYFKSKNYDEALRYFQKALDIEKSQRDSIGMATVLGNIGGINIYQGHFNEADSNFHIAKAIYERLGHKRGIIQITNHLGVLYEQQGLFEKAREQYLQGLTLAKELSVMGITISNTHNIASTYFKQENFTAAESWFLQEKDLVVELGDSIGMQRTFRSLAELYSKKGDYKQAMEWMFNYDEINRILVKRESNQLIKNLKFKYELYDKEKELNLLEKKNAIQTLEIERKNLIVYGLIAITLLTIIMLVFYMKFRSQKLKADNIMLQNQLLRSQINPHYIFNAFNSIQAYFINKEYDSGQFYLRNFASLIRKFLEKTEKEFSTIEEEIEMIQRYLELEKMRLVDQMEFEINVDPDIDIKDCMIPAFVVQTYLENAIIHGISELDGKGHIQVDLTAQGDGLKLTIKDDGIGINVARKNKLKYPSLHESKGMKITQERISYLRRRRKHKIFLEISDLSETTKNEIGTLVTLTFPKIYLS